MSGFLTHPSHSLVFDGMSLTGRPEVQVLAQNADFGAPQPVETAFPTGLFDGDFVFHVKDGNREIRLDVLIDAETGLDLALFGEELASHLSKRTTLIWTPPQANAPAGVYDVLTSSMSQNFDDLGELRTERVFSLRLVCAPYVRSTTSVTVAALAAGGGSQTVISDGTSATNWTSTNGAVTSVSGALRFSAPGSYVPIYGAPGSGFMYYTANARVSMSSTNFTTTPFVSIDVPKTYTVGGETWAITPQVVLQTSVQTADFVSVSTSPANSAYWRFVFYAAHAGVTSLTFLMAWNQGPSTNVTALPVTYGLDNVTRSPTSPATATTRESIRTIPIVGSVRTPGSLSVKRAASLGFPESALIVYTCTDPQNGNSPSLRQYRLSGGTITTGVSGNFSGSEEVWDNDIVFAIPAPTLQSGGYGIFANIKDGAPGTFSVTRTIQTYIGSTPIGPEQVKRISVTTGPNARGVSGEDYNIVSLGGATLPPNAVDPGASTATVRVKLTNNSGRDLVFDEGFAFFRASNVDPTKRGALTIMTGGAQNVWLDSPDLSNVGRQAIWTGANAVRTDAFHAGPLTLTWGRHEFTPGSTVAFVADCSSGIGATSAAAAVSFNYFPRGHSSALQ